MHVHFTVHFCLKRTAIIEIDEDLIQLQANYGPPHQSVFFYLCPHFAPYLFSK